jgi:hypothetical protein
MPQAPGSKKSALGVEGVDAITQRAELSISFEKPVSSYSAGELVRGYAQLDVKQSIDVAEAIVELRAEACTYESFKPTGQPKQSLIYANDCHLLMLQGTRLAFPSQRLSVGLHQAPFQFEIPVDAPASMQMKVVNGNALNIYRVELYLKCSGWSSRHLCHRVAIAVNSATPPKLSSPGELMENLTVWKWGCCSNNSGIDVRIATDRRVYKEGDQIVVTLKAHNYSNQHVSRINVRLMEGVSWRTKYSLKEAGEDVDSLAWKESDQAIRVLQQFNLEGKGGVHKGEGFGNTSALPPRIARSEPLKNIRFCSSASSHLITVSFWIEIRMVTASILTNNPILCMPVLIYRTAPQPDARDLPDMASWGGAHCKRLPCPGNPEFDAKSGERKAPLTAAARYAPTSAVRWETAPKGIEIERSTRTVPQAPPPEGSSIHWQTTPSAAFETGSQL